MNIRDLKLRVRALVLRRQVERELHEELAFHLERDTRKHLAGGLEPIAARRQAGVRFGSMSGTAEACREARGTALVDGVVRDVLYALRAFRRAPMTALVIVTTVGLGLGLVAALFTFLNVFLFRVDEVRDPGALYEVEVANPGDLAFDRPSGRGVARSRFTRPDYEAMRRETTVFSDLFAMLPDLDGRVDGRMMAATLVTGNFFEALGVTAALGRTLTPADDERFASRPVMVLSHQGWSRRFDGDPAVVGRTVVVNGRPFEIVGVMREGFRGLVVGAPDYWAPLSMASQFRDPDAGWPGGEDQVGIEIVGRLKPGVSRQAAVASLVAWDLESNGVASLPGGLPHLTLESRRGTIEAPLEMVLVSLPLFFAFGLVLAIGCANVANLLVARGFARQRELGIRLSLGASRARIIRQLLTESLLLALVAAALGYAISRVVLEGTVRLVMSTLAPELTESFDLNVPAADWRVPLFLLGGAIGSTVLFGVGPAFQATRLELVRTIRGELTRGVRPFFSRHWLIGLQVTASALLLICAGVFLRSAFEASKFDVGLRTEDTVVIQIVDEKARAALIQAVMSDPVVDAAAASWPGPLGPRMTYAEAGGTRSLVPFRFVSPEYFSVLGIALVRGRGFADDERSRGAGVAIISETIARRLWPDVDALGQTFRLERDTGRRRADLPDVSGRTLTVIGVARDVPAFRLADYEEEAGIYIPVGAADAGTTLTARVHGDPDQARLGLLARLTAVDPNLGEIRTMRSLAGMEAYLLAAGFWVTLAIGGLALALTFSGLFSVLSYLVEQRTREIGIRMALGATTRNIGRLVLTQSGRPVALGLVAGTGMAAGLASVLMATPAAAQISRSVRVFDPTAYVLSAAVIAVACLLAALVPVRRAIRIDPIDSLRQD